MGTGMLPIISTRAGTDEEPANWERQRLYLHKHKKNPYSKNHRDIQNYVNQLHSLSDSNCDSYGGADHRVVAHTHKAHHLDVCRN